MILPVEKIGDTLVVFTTNYQGMASEPFVIEEGKDIYVYLKMLFIQMHIIR